MLGQATTMTMHYVTLVSFKELQSLIEALNFACKVVPSGRPFLQRMIELVTSLNLTTTLSLVPGFPWILKLRKHPFPTRTGLLYSYQRH